MKVILLGATGLIGSAFAQAALRRGFQLLAIGFGNRPALPDPHQNFQIDLRESHALERMVFDHFPDVIVNAAAYSHAAALEGVTDAQARLLNVELPERLAQLAHHISARFYHLSTDTVFDGTHAPYRTTDVPNPQTPYAQLKAESEKQVLAFGGYESTVLRLSVVNGNSPAGNRSLHEKLFHRWMAGEETILYTDEIRQPCLADNVADLLVELCERPNLHGLFHWAGADALSFYEIGRRIAAHFGLPESLAVAGAQPADPALRRGDLSLVLAPLEGKVKTRPLTFDEQLDRLIVPEACRAWFEKTSSKPLPPRRLIKGVDF